MDILKSIKSLFSSNAVKIEAPEGFCPNCWGKQEYQGEIIKAMKNQDINAANIKGWVQEYAEKHFYGIKKKQEGDKMVCPKCSK